MRSPLAALVSFLVFFQPWLCAVLVCLSVVVKESYSKGRKSFELQTRADTQWIRATDRHLTIGGEYVPQCFIIADRGEGFPADASAHRGRQSSLGREWHIGTNTSGELCWSSQSDEFKIASINAYTCNEKIWKQYVDERGRRWWRKSETDEFFFTGLDSNVDDWLASLM